MDPNAFPATPRWNLDRPFLTGRFHEEIDIPAKNVSSKSVYTDSFSRSATNPLGYYSPSVQENKVIDDLLSAMVGIEGRYISIRKVRGKEGRFIFLIDASMDLVLQEWIEKMFPLCNEFLCISQFVETKSHYKHGLVNHAFAAALRAFLLDYQAMVAQLEHQFRLGRLSIQGLWFYCQPMLGAIHALSIVVEKASAANISGSATLNLLQSQAKAMAGDSAVSSLLEKMTECASSPYLGILERWVYEGIIDDPYGEFFIAENKSLKKESLSQDYDAKYWKHRYTLKDDIPNFLTNAAGTVLTTGKYLNVMRECGHNVQVLLSDRPKLMNFGANHQYLKCIKAAYEFASGELLKLTKEKYDLMGKLRSMKRYLLLDQGDFLVHFMDIARDELVKRPEDISAEKLQSLLDLALRTTAAASDPCHEELACCVERTSLVNRLGTLKDLEHGIKKSPAKLSEKNKSVSNVNGELDEPVSITGLDTFSLSYKVQWPLSLIISRKALTKYQLLFRFLFHCRHVSRQLCVAWQVHQGFRSFNTLGTAITRSSLLCRSMLKFINSLLHYLTFEVLEPNWHVMHDRLQTAKSIDEVIQYHDYFLEKCLKEFLLLLPHLLKKVETLKSICLQYAAAVQVLMPSMYISDPDIADSLASLKGKKPKGRGQALKPATDCTSVRDSILSFEKEFNAELHSLGPFLSSSSQAEPFLTHLAQCILGSGSDQ
ncbi:hypothetical protein QJS10_CPA02g00644 [Acorus calamus]|uniref:Gamma-tubulin complex component n=1 Tax=Acorus calamus TaxID=4465 RepID=A0AAV9FCN5_ACOCL|nr:hypothetical protein QJS10_CPA02g00644 [Acorus calamus]